MSVEKTLLTKTELVLERSLLADQAYEYIKSLLFKGAFPPAPGSVSNLWPNAWE